MLITADNVRRTIFAFGETEDSGGVEHTEHYRRMARDQHLPARHPAQGSYHSFYGTRVDPIFRLFDENETTLLVEVSQEGERKNAKRSVGQHPTRCSQSVRERHDDVSVTIVFANDSIYCNDTGHGDGHMIDPELESLGSRPTLEIVNYPGQIRTIVPIETARSWRGRQTHCVGI